MSFVSIIIPVYNNSKSLPDLLVRFQNLATQNKDDQFEFVFVDDGSVDDSLGVLKNLSNQDDRLRIVKLSRNFGSNAALMAGVSLAKGDVVAAIAADLQDPPELIHEMLAHWRDGNKIVLAARETRDDGMITSAISDIFYSLFRRFAIKSMPKHGFDFFLIDRQVCDLINQNQENNVYLMGLILWTGFDPKVITYHRSKRQKRYGHSMWTLTKKIKYFIDSFVAFSYFPIRSASCLGFLMSVVGVIYAAYIISLRLMFAIKAEGWTSLMVAVLLLSGAQMVIMGILGEYLWRNLDETRKRPPFIIDSQYPKIPDHPRAQEFSEE